MEAKTLLLNLSKHGLVRVLNQTTVCVSKGGAIVKCRLLTPHTSIQIFFFLACLVKICQREKKLEESFTPCLRFSFQKKDEDFFSFLTKELPFKYLQTFVWRLMDEMIFLVMQNSFDKIVSWCWKHFLDRLRHFWPPVDLFVFQFWTSQMLMGCVHKLKS